MHKTWTSYTLVLSLFFTCSELNTLLKPDKQRANELKREFEKGFVGIARRIWPNLTHAHGVVTGKESFSSAVTNILLFCLWYFRPRYFKHWWIVQFRVSYVNFTKIVIRIIGAVRHPAAKAIPEGRAPLLHYLWRHWRINRCKFMAAWEHPLLSTGASINVLWIHTNGIQPRGTTKGMKNCSITTR